MLSAEFKKLIAPQARVLNLIWGALAFATIFYVAVAWFMFGQGTPGDLDAGGLPSVGRSNLNLIGAIVLVLLGLGSVYYERKSFGASVLKDKLARDPDWLLAGTQGVGGTTVPARGHRDRGPDPGNPAAGLQGRGSLWRSRIDPDAHENAAPHEVLCGDPGLIPIPRHTRRR